MIYAATRREVKTKRHGGVQKEKEGGLLTVGEAPQNVWCAHIWETLRRPVVKKGGEPQKTPQEVTVCGAARHKKVRGYTQAAATQPRMTQKNAGGRTNQAYSIHCRGRRREKWNGTADHQQMRTITRGRQTQLQVGRTHKLPPTKLRGSSPEDKKKYAGPTRSERGYPPPEGRKQHPPGRDQRGGRIDSGGAPPPTGGSEKREEGRAPPLLIYIG